MADSQRRSPEGVAVQTGPATWDVLSAIEVRPGQVIVQAGIARLRFTPSEAHVLGMRLMNGAHEAGLDPCGPYGSLGPEQGDG